MYLEDDETLDGQYVLVDTNIHKKAKCTREKFLEKVQYVKTIRTARNGSHFSFYIATADEYENLIRFHDLINKGIFYFQGYTVFAVAVQPKLYEWFKSTDITTIQKQIVCWLAGCYFFNPDKRDIHKRQLYKLLFEEMLKIVETYYDDFDLPNFQQLEQRFRKNNESALFDETDRCCEKYIQVCNQYYNSNPPEFLASPFKYENLMEWGVNDSYNFEFIEAYFNERDWDNIINNNSKDSLERVESRDYLWLRWQHVFRTFDKRNNFVYTFFLEQEAERKVKMKREKISQAVMNIVWQRDNGKCVSCGGNEKLEFDHIIPFSKGGSSTYRNLQLLCETCNRKKYNHIG